MDTSPADSTNKTNYSGERSHIDGKPQLNKNNSCSSSSSTSSSDSSDGDFFQLDPAELEKPMQPGSTHETLPAQQQIRLRMTNAAAAGHEDKAAAAGELGGPTQSPQVQVMGRPDVHDPNRIPSSIFARTKSTAQMEWSVASNESLFSIHMGNSSFSRDHVFLLGSPPPGPPFSPASRTPSSSLPPLSPGPRSANRIDQAQPQPQPQPQPRPQPALGTTEATNAEAMKDVLQAAAEEEHDDSGEKIKASGDLINNSARLSRQSDGSATSFRSFAFPILTGEGRSGSVKVELPAEQKPQPASKQAEDHDQSEQQQTPKGESPAAAAAAPAAATEAKGWLSCFSCCPFCR